AFRSTRRRSASRSALLPPGLRSTPPEPASRSRRPAAAARTKTCRRRASATSSCGFSDPFIAAVALPSPAGFAPRVHPLRKKMDCRVTSAFTRVFNALCPAMTTERKRPTAAFGRLFSWRKRMPPTPEQTELGYHRMWDRAQIAPAKRDGARKIARAIIANRARYAAVEQATGVLWFIIAPIPPRESDRDFAPTPHNGDSPKPPPHHVPAGRPKRGNPPFPWDASAIDALTMAPHELQKVKAWSVERILYETEKYNGWGYLKRGNSPYLWSWTSEYHGRKY